MGLQKVLLWGLVPLLLTVGAGATIAPAMAAGLGGEARVGVRQGVLFKDVQVANLPALAEGYARVGGQGTRFVAAVDQLPTGSYFDLELTLANQGSSAAFGLLRLTLPDGLEAQVKAVGAAAGRVGAAAWEVRLDPGAEGTVTVRVSVPWGLPDGEFTVGVAIEALESVAPAT